MIPALASAAAGRSETSFDVSGSGTARYSLPLQLPPGTAGLQPNLAINYDSSAGDGLLGQGFSISGLSVLRHCPRTLAQDGVAAPIAYGTAARYCLDGQRLRLTSGTHGQAGAVYRTEIETFSRITAHGTAGSSPAHFVVERKDGLIYEYGNSSDSRIEIAGSSTVRLWALSRIRDRAGNYIEFAYTKDSTNGSYRPHEIRYTGNAGQGLNPVYTVRFVYQTAPRPDPSYGYFPAGTGTGQVNTVTRIDRIELLHQTTVTRTWQVSWDPTGGAAGQSRIASIQECAGTPSDCFPPTSFSWQSGTPGFGSEGTLSGLGAVQVMDLTGSGRADLVYVSGGTWRYRPGNAAGGFGAEVNTGVSASGQTPVDVFEWDGDGRDDLLVIQSGTYRVLRSTGTGFAAPINTGIAANNSQLFDINGDGRHDLVRASINAGMLQIHVRLRTATGFATTETLAYAGDAGTGMSIGSANWTTASIQRRQRTHRPNWDFSGDGREGFVLALGVEDPEQYWPPYLLWAVFTPTGDTGNPQLGMMGSVGGPGYVSQLDPVPMDVNGDGLVDLVYATGGTYRIRFSRGWYFTGQVTGPAITGHVTTTSAVTDYDGDGIADFVVRSSSTNTWHVMRGTGTGLAAPINTGLSAANAAAPRIGDFNGDGLPDLLWNNVSTGAWHHRPRAGLYPDLLAQATDGYGNTVSFQYDSIARNNYTKQSAAVYPEIDFAGPMQVVTSLAASDGVGGAFTQNFSYHGARVHAEGRGFLGFHAVRRQDSRNNLYAWAYFERSFPFTGGVFKNELYQPNGTTLIARDVHTWASHSYGTGHGIRRLPYISQTVGTRYEAGGSYNAALVSTVNTVNTVDSATGTLIDTTTTVTEASTANGIQGGASYVMRSWTSALYTSTTDWCLGRPQTIQSIHSHNQFGGSQVTRQQNVTWNGPFCRPAQVVEAQGDSQWQMTTAWGYDGFGNINSETVTGVGMSPRTTTTNWGTTGQFPISVTNALSQTTQLGWNYAKGVQTSQTDPNGIGITWDHDAFGRLVLEARPDNTSTTLSYGDCAGLGCVNSNNRLVVTETEYAAGGGKIRDTFHYLDRFDRPLVTRAQLLSGAYNRIERQYDAQGRLYRESAPCWWGACSLYWTTHSYDLLDRLIQSTRPLSASDPTPQLTTTFYEGLTTRIVDPLGKETRQIGNVLGSLARTRDHDSHHKSFDYNPFGDLLRVTDNLGNTLQSNTYNVRGMLTAQTDMDRGAWTFQSNALGEITHVRDAKTGAPNWTTVIGYDALGRMTSRQDVPEGVTSTWTWGTSSAAKNIGRLASVSGPGYSESYTYDSLGRPLETTVNADAQYKIEYGYNSLGALATLTYPVSTSGYRLKLQYDYQHGQVLRIKDFNAPSTVFWQANATDARGRAIDEQLGASLQRIRGFDPVSGRIEYIQTGPGGNAAVQNLVYQWDGVGNLSWRRDDNQNLTEAFSYDHLHRLTSSTLNGTNNLSVAYNALGNIISKTGVGTYTYHATKKQAVVSTSSGGSYAYDANGNMTSRNGSTISWSSFNLPTVIHGSGSNQSQFFYTPDRARYRQVANYAGTVETTIYVGGILEKLTRGALTEFKHVIQAGQEHTVIYTRRSNGTTDTFHVTRDHLGSAAAITDASGNVLVQESFTAFGERRGANWAGAPSSADWTQIASTTRRGFTGHEHLDNLNLIHMNGRVYDPGLGRFLSADPFIDGWTSTQGYNRYSYVHNNPLRFRDPSGFKGKKLDEREEGEGESGSQYINPDGRQMEEIVVIPAISSKTIARSNPYAAVSSLYGFDPHQNTYFGTAYLPTTVVENSPDHMVVVPKAPFSGRRADSHLVQYALLGAETAYRSSYYFLSEYVAPALGVEALYGGAFGAGGLARGHVSFDGSLYSSAEYVKGYGKFYGVLFTGSYSTKPLSGAVSTMGACIAGGAAVCFTVQMDQYGTFGFSSGIGAGVGFAGFGGTTGLRITGHMGD